MKTENISMSILFIGMTLIGLYGLFNFDKVFIVWRNFMNSKNTMNISYPTGTYTKVVLKITLYMCLIMGIIGSTSLILIDLNILKP